MTMKGGMVTKPDLARIQRLPPNKVGTEDIVSTTHEWQEKGANSDGPRNSNQKDAWHKRAGREKEPPNYSGTKGKHGGERGLANGQSQEAAKGVKQTNTP